MKKYHYIAFMVAVEDKDVDNTVNNIHDYLFDKVQYVFGHETGAVEELDTALQEEFKNVIEE